MISINGRTFTNMAECSRYLEDPEGYERSASRSAKSSVEWTGRTAFTLTHGDYTIRRDGDTFHLNGPVCQNTTVDVTSAYSIGGAFKFENGTCEIGGTTVMRDGLPTVGATPQEAHDEAQFREKMSRFLVSLSAQLPSSQLDAARAIAKRVHSRTDWKRTVAREKIATALEKSAFLSNQAEAELRRALDPSWAPPQGGQTPSAKLVANLQAMSSDMKRADLVKSWAKQTGHSIRPSELATVLGVMSSDMYRVDVLGALIGGRQPENATTSSLGRKVAPAELIAIARTFRSDMYRTDAVKKVVPHLQSIDSLQDLRQMRSLFSSSMYWNDVEALLMR